MLQGDLMGLYSSWQEVGEMGFSSQETAIRWEGAVPGQGRLGMKRNLFSKEWSRLLWWHPGKGLGKEPV